MNNSPAAGMPAHPPLAHVVVGGYTVATILDLLSLAVPAAARGLYVAGGYTLMIGTGALFLAAVAGLVDRARRTSPGTRQRRAAGRHALVAVSAGAIAVVDIVLRRHFYQDASRVPAAVLVLTVLVGVLVTVGGHLGGRLVFQAGVGVRRAP